MTEFVDVKPYRWGNPADKHRLAWNAPLYKYVDLEHADAFAAGSVKIGTLWGYRRIEGARQDGDENTVPVALGHAELHGNNPRHRLLFRSMGLEIDDEMVVVPRGATIKIQGPDFYAVCFAKSENLPQLEIGKRQAVFKIDEPLPFINHICSNVATLGPAMCSEVRYQDRSIARLVGGMVTPSPFIKPLEFIGEQEVRIIWKVNADTEMGFLPEIAPTGPDPVVAKLVKRIR